NWRCSINRTGPVPFERIHSPQTGFFRYKISLRAAAEFVLRKDYRAHWDTELLEEYTYFKQSDFENAFRKRGMRIVVSMPIWNPWIVANRFEGKFFLCDLQGASIPFPPTNFLIVGEKAGPGAGVEIKEREKRIIPKTNFLTLHGYREKENE